MNNPKLSIYEEETDTYRALPTRWCICGTCSGNGKHSNHLGVIDPEDWDDESIEDYCSGAYDKICEECKGSGKVQVVDFDRMSISDTALYHEQQWKLGEADREAEMERRMGA